MKKRRIISFLTFAILLFSFLLSGCFNNNAAKDSAEIYCSLIFKSNTDNIKKIGVSDSDKYNLIKEYKDKIKDQLKKNLLLMEYSVSDEQLNSVCEEYQEVLSKITYDVKQISKSGNDAEVEITTTHFDAKEINDKAAIDALDETDNLDFESIDNGNNKFIELYLSKLADGLKNAEISSEKSSTTLKFKKVNGYWVADDGVNLGFKLVQLATTKENSDLNIDEESISPEESAKVFWDLAINEDSSVMEKLGYNKSLIEKIIKNMNKSNFKTYKNDINKYGTSFSDDQIQEIVNALKSALSKTSAKFEEVSREDNLAQVKISSTSINVNSIIKDAVNDTKNQILSNRIRDKQKIVDFYIENIIASINRAQVSSVSNENTFNFTKIGTIWLPSNVTSYVQCITSMGIEKS